MGYSANDDILSNMEIKLECLSSTIIYWKWKAMTVEV